MKVKAAGGAVLARFSSGTGGSFQLALPPCRYTVSSDLTAEFNRNDVFFVIPVESSRARTRKHSAWKWR
jgi:hypothetical protein